MGGPTSGRYEPNPRRQEVLDALRAGMHVSEAAQKFQIKEQTVKMWKSRFLANPETLRLARQEARAVAVKIAERLAPGSIVKRRQEIAEERRANGIGEHDLATPEGRLAFLRDVARTASENVQVRAIEVIDTMAKQMGMGIGPKAPLGREGKVRELVRLNVAVGREIMEEARSAAIAIWESGGVNEGKTEVVQTPPDGDVAGRDQRQRVDAQEGSQGDAAADPERGVAGEEDAAGGDSARGRGEG